MKQSIGRWVSRVSAFAAFAAFALAGTAMAAGPVPEAVKAEMAKISRMAGQWKGSGWIAGREGRTTFNSEETVEPRLDGAALLIEGFHRDTKTNAVVHHALAILAWDVHRNEYRMQSSLADGRNGSFPGKVEDGKFVWRMELENAPWSRFTISFEDADRWLEVGESSRDGGKTWFKFFEMDLRRVK